MTVEEKHHKRKIERLLAIGAAVFATILIAAFAGLLLALVHMDRSFADLAYAMTYTGPPPVTTEEAIEEKTEESVETLSPVEQDTEGQAAASEAEAEMQNQTISDNTVSDNSVSGNTVSDNTVSDNSVSDNAVEELTYPQPFQLVDERYFDDALFIGDSRMEGFGLHSGLKSTFYAATGLQLHEIDRYKVVRTANGKVPIFSVMQPGVYKKVYIKVGLNELGWGTDELFLQEYADLIARIRELEPDAIIYVHGLIHVTAAKSESDKIHTNEAINARNAMLQQFAAEQQAYYVDINEVVSDATGALLPDLTSDGIHLKAKYMELWKNYLMAHAVATGTESATPESTAAETEQAAD